MEKVLAGGRTRMSGKILKMVQLSILTALLIVMSVTPLGYLTVGPVSITLLMIPVVIGAIVCGPEGGAFLGLVFGLTSFLRCVTGAEALGALAWTANPFGAFLMCVPTRVLAGYLPGLFVKAVDGKARHTVIFPAAALMGSVLNTILFLSTLLLTFGKNPEITSGLGFSQGGSIVAYIAATFAATNGLVEAIACTLVGAGLAAAMIKFMPAATGKPPQGR
jgi:uncharacterized membrane protein